MLEVKNLHANVNGKEILKGINLSVKAGEVHAIMGPNGSGKSTLSSVLVGNPAFEVTEGEVIFNGKNLLDLSPEDRSREGIFLSFQYPVEIPGVSMVNFMRAALNEHRKYNGLEPVSATDFLKLMREKRAIVELDNKLASRSVNEGFSGGEKKRNEIFQMAMLEPKLAILDETDRCLAYRSAWREPVEDSGECRYRNHALSASAGLHQAGCGSCALQRPYREDRRSGIGLGTGRERLRLDQERDGR